MPKHLTIHEIVKKYLIDNNYDGLVGEFSQCSCRVGDLFPCSECNIDMCMPGHSIPCPKDCELGCKDVPHIAPGPRPA